MKKENRKELECVRVKGRSESPWRRVVPLSQGPRGRQDRDRRTLNDKESDILRLKSTGGLTVRLHMLRRNCGGTYGRVWTELSKD